MKGGRRNKVKGREKGVRKSMNWKEEREKESWGRGRRMGKEREGSEIKGRRGDRAGGEERERRELGAA